FIAELDSFKIANESLIDSDLLHRNRVLNREAEDAWRMGKVVLVRNFRGIWNNDDFDFVSSLLMVIQ
ncbi:hypothetical protein J1N35_018506, partial [Gossypium stocksii]